MSPGPLIVAALLAAALAMRWRRWPLRPRAFAVAVVIALAAWGSGAIHLPSLETISRDGGARLGDYTYAVVGLMALLETGAGIGLVAPGELAVVIGGVTAGQGHTNLVLLIAIVWACALTGDLTSYFLGRRLGRSFLLRHGHLVKLTPDRLAQVETFLRRHGGKTIILGRFVGLVRSVAPFVAGSSRMPAGRFIPATFVASGLWSATFCLLGYVFWQSFDEAAELAREGTLVFAAVVLIAVGAVIVWRRRRERRRQMGVTPHSHGASHPVRSGTGKWPGANPKTAKENP
ncbi:MAG TPA: DedA family protein [Solirubrobacteraceae bacterium]|nr:DedA family protein [Solirubrobacteraceae bacterium]